MAKIYKYPLKLEKEQTVDIPAGSTILSVQNQRDSLVLYVRVPDSLEVTRSVKIITVGTGDDAPTVETAKYLGTTMFSNGYLVLHTFVEIPSLINSPDIESQGISW